MLIRENRCADWLAQQGALGNNLDPSDAEQLLSAKKRFKTFAFTAVKMLALWARARELLGDLDRIPSPHPSPVCDKSLFLIAMF